MSIDRELTALCVERDRLLRELAPTLRRVGPNHPERSAQNAKRAKRRRKLRDALKQNAARIVACVMAEHHAVPPVPRRFADDKEMNDVQR